MTPMYTHRLSVVLVIGAQRSRAQTVLDGIGAQCCEGLEAVLLDLCPDLPALSLPAGLDLQHIRQNLAGGLEAARALGLHRARAPYVAYLEDHCCPTPGWAQSVVQAFDSGPWAAVGYAFINANPQSWVSRGCMLADYGPWAAPHPDVELKLLPGNNVAYRRDVLLCYGERLVTLLSPDFVLHERLRLDGQRLFLAGSAVAAHQNPKELGFLLMASHAYCRMLASHRARSGSWGLVRRWTYALGTPLAAPVIKLVRMKRFLQRRPGLLIQLAAFLPILIPTFLWSAVGESLGYAFGPGRAKAQFEDFELNRSRV
jgi:hypothetical protein